jgi:hypothetical protein
MAHTFNTYRNSIKQLVKEVLEEMYDTPPFKADFNISKDLDGNYTTEEFVDRLGNKIEVVFSQDEPDVWLIDFKVNGNSVKSREQSSEYTLKDFTTLIQTVAKATQQFINQQQPLGVRVEGFDAFYKILSGKKNQKVNLYHYFATQLSKDIPYRVGQVQDGSFMLQKK